MPDKFPTPDNIQEKLLKAGIVPKDWTFAQARNWLWRRGLELKGLCKEGTPWARRCKVQLSGNTRLPCCRPALFLHPYSSQASFSQSAQGLARGTSQTHSLRPILAPEGRHGLVADCKGRSDGDSVRMAHFLRDGPLRDVHGVIQRREEGGR